MFKRAILLLSAALGLAAHAPAAFAQASTYPSKPVTLIVPFSPGGALDNVARGLAETLKGHLGTSIIVENRPGGNYMVGTRALLQSPADGHTLMLTTNGMMSITPVLYANTQFDPIKDFTQVGLVSTYPYVLLTGKNRYPSLAAVLKEAKAKPEQVSMAFTGHVTSLSVDLLGHLTQSRLMKVPYKGDPDAVSDLASGRVDIGMFGPSVALSLVNGGKLDALAVTTNTRMALLKDTPTTNEQGLNGFNVVVWTGLIAPAKVPESSLKILQAALRKTLEDPKFLAHLARTGDTILPGDTEAFRARVIEEQKLWKKVMEDSNTAPIQS